MKENPMRGAMIALPLSMILWALMLAGCRSTGGWEYSGTIPLLGDWRIAHKITPSEPGKPVDLTFVDPIMAWIVGPITAGSTGADGSTQTNPVTP